MRVEKKKRGKRVWKSLNVDVIWSDVPSYVKALSKTNDHISYVGEDNTYIYVCILNFFNQFCVYFFSLLIPF